MKKTILLLLAIIFIFSCPSNASSYTIVITDSSVIKSKTPLFTSLPAFMSMKLKALEIFAGRKFTFKEKVQIKILQIKYKKHFKKRNYTPMDQDRQANWAFIAGLVTLGMVFLAILNLAGILLLAVLIPSAFIAFWLGLKSVKNNKNFKSIFGIIVGALTIGAAIVISISALIFL